MESIISGVTENRFARLDATEGTRDQLDRWSRQVWGTSTIAVSTCHFRFRMATRIANAPAHQLRNVNRDN